jgi:hypothetical protein
MSEYSLDLCMQVRIKAFGPSRGCRMAQIPIWVNLGGTCNRGCWYTLWPVGPICGHLVYFIAVWITLWPRGTFFPFWFVVQRQICQPWSYFITCVILKAYILHICTPRMYCDQHVLIDETYRPFWGFVSCKKSLMCIDFLKFSSQSRQSVHVCCNLELNAVKC